MITQEQLEEVFKKHVSYDCSGYEPEKKCPNCNHLLQRESRWGFWLDHRSVLAGYLSEALHLPIRCRDEFDEWLAEQYITGDPVADAKEICGDILKEWGPR